MKLNIKKEVSEKGKVILYINGVKVSPDDYPYTELSVYRELNGILSGCTYVEPAEGVFATTRRWVRFHWGDFVREWDTEEFGEMCITDPVEKIAEVIEKRIRLVRDWIENCKTTAGEVEIVDLPELAEELYERKRLYYRDSKGRIRKFD